MIDSVFAWFYFYPLVRNEMVQKYKATVEKRHYFKLLNNFCSFKSLNTYWSGTNYRCSFKEHNSYIVWHLSPFVCIYRSYYAQLGSYWSLHLNYLPVSRNLERIVLLSIIKFTFGLEVLKTSGFSWFRTVEEVLHEGKLGFGRAWKASHPCKCVKWWIKFEKLSGILCFLNVYFQKSCEWY